jgi:hypothetical protein
MFAALTLVLLSQPLTLCIQCRSILAKLLSLFVKLRTNGLLEYHPFFSQQSLGVAEFGLLPLNQLLLLTQTTCPQFQFGSELAMLAANASNLGGELPGAKFERGAIGLQLLLVSNQIGPPLTEFCKSLLQGFGSHRRLQQDFVSVEFGGVRADSDGRRARAGRRYRMASGLCRLIGHVRDSLPKRTWTRFDTSLRSARNCLVDRSGNCTFGHQTNEFLDVLAIFENDHAWNTRNTVRRGRQLFDGRAQL